MAGGSAVAAAMTIDDCCNSGGRRSMDEGAVDSAIAREAARDVAGPTKSIDSTNGKWSERAVS